MIFKITKVLIVTQHVLINFLNKETSIKIIYYFNLQLQFSAIQFTFIVFDFKASKLVCSLHFFEHYVFTSYSDLGFPQNGSP